MTQSVNPLRAYFRQPAIYIRLPSGGQYWPEGSLDIPANGELPVFPMTAVDEIAYRTPDALYNGQSTVDVIQSCVPNVKNAWKMPGIDFNSLLISIRIASYGHEMEVMSTCPKCSNQSEYVMDLRSIMDQLGKPDYGQTIQLGDLEIFFRPMLFDEQNKVNIQQFETQKTIALLTESTESEDTKISQMSEVMKRITAATAQALSYSIAGIRTPDSFVVDNQHIVEFMTNCDRHVFNAIRDHAVNLRGVTDIKPVLIVCSSCENQYEQAVSLDMSSFFAVAS